MNVHECAQLQSTKWKNKAYLMIMEKFYQNA